MRAVPDELKISRGETRPSRMAGTKVLNFPLLDRHPNPPDWIGPEGQKLWYEIMPILFDQKILTDADVNSLAHLCCLHGDIVSGYRIGVRPTASELAQLRMYFAEFGMTPSSRTKVNAQGKDGKTNKFSNNGRRVKHDST